MVSFQGTFVHLGGHIDFHTKMSTWNLGLVASFWPKGSPNSKSGYIGATVHLLIRDIKCSMGHLSHLD